MSPSLKNILSLFIWPNLIQVHWVASQDFVIDQYALVYSNAMAK